MGKCASRSGSRRDPDCGMVYGGMKRAWSFLKEFPGTESFVPTFPHRLNCTSRVDSIPGCFSATCRSNLHEHGMTGQARARVERSTLSTTISTRYVLGTPEPDWAYSVYGNVNKEIPNDIPEPFGKEVVLWAHVDANLYHCMVTGRACSALLLWANQTLIDWRASL